MSESKLMTVTEVAAVARVSDYTVREWLRLGRLRGIKLGGARAGWRISEDELARFIAAATSKGEPPADAEERTG